MQDWQNRVIQEKTELDERRKKLHKFIGNRVVYPELQDDYWIQLCTQLSIMAEYSHILEKRIFGFDD